MSDEHDWLGDLPGVKDIQDAAGITYPRRARLRFEGATVADDPVNGRTVVSVPGSGAAPNDYVFANDGFSLKVAPQHVATLSSIADSGDDSTAATLGSDGIYLFTVIATATGSGGSYLVAYKVRGQLSSGTLTLGTPVPIEADDTGDIDLSFADDSGALEVTVSNTSGVTVNALVAVGWLFCPVPAAP